MYMRFIELILLIGLLFNAPAFAASPESVLAMQSRYDASQVVYDVTSGDPEKLSNILDRVSMLQNLYGADPFDASIVVIIHDAAIPQFVKSKTDNYRELVKRARSLSMGDVIKFRMCSASAKMQGYRHEDIHDFIVMVPMADAELIKLQHDGYALMN